MNTVVFGKTMENMRKLFGEETIWYHNQILQQKVFTENFKKKEKMKKTEIPMNKPVHLGL